jgi:hypothetical protein
MVEGVTSEAEQRGVHEFNDWKQLRVTTNLDDDPDWAGAQTIPPAAGTVELGRPGGYADDAPLRLKVEIVLEWLTSLDVLVVGRGTYNVEALRVATRRAPLTGSVVVDSAKLTGQMAHRPVVIDDLLVGDQFTVRLTTMQPPGGGGAAKARILYREIV